MRRTSLQNQAFATFLKNQPDGLQLRPELSIWRPPSLRNVTRKELPPADDGLRKNLLVRRSSPLYNPACGQSSRNAIFFISGNLRIF
jgi:hypothetical protein